MDALSQHRVQQIVAVALSRTVLLTRAVVCLTTAIVGLLVQTDGIRSAALIVVLLISTAAGVAALPRWPTLVRSPVPLLTADAVLVMVVLALSKGGMTYFVFAAGAAALAGAALGFAAIPLWTAQTVQGLVVCAVLLDNEEVPAALAGFLLAAPPAAVLAGIGTVLAKRVLTRQMSQTVELITDAQRSAAAAERARLARELHDSVAKTLRAMSLAAVALPGSLRRQPALAEQLADVISQGATAASQEARQLIEGMRLDAPEEDFATTLRRVCALWSAETGISATATVAPVEPPVAVRYELTRIVGEALVNVHRHAAATRVGVTVTERGRGVILTVRDNGRGFDVPYEADLAALQHRGHAGIVGMMERARTIGGTLTVESEPGLGTLIRVRVPVL
ncbi:sensor histidine kinase [Kineosporia babensis]|uniref:Histidine kinase n=1 Tax=Kineosporia babensis TaxID=499548 RepID=A0A9X1NEE7_9ACTN|nr:histidine kinase [Kineosporia babensis]